MILRLTIASSLLLAAIALSLCLGDVNLPPGEIWTALTDKASAGLDAGVEAVVWQIRLPRTVVALVVGAALSVSGYILQALSRNYLADPYLTGVSSGAGLAVACAIMIGVDFNFVPAAAFTGGLAASILVALMARSPAGLSVTKLLLSGVAVSAVCGAFITLCLTNSSSLARTQGLFFWLAGGIAGRTWEELTPAALYAGAGFAVALLLSKPLRLLSLGAPTAASLGLNVSRASWALLASAVVLCGASVSVSGLVGFVGLIGPNIARNLFGRDERLHLISSALVGAVLVLVSDIAARTLTDGQELPLGTLLSLVGGPFFLWLVLHHRGEGL